MATGQSAVTSTSTGQFVDAAVHLAAVALAQLVAQDVRVIGDLLLGEDASLHLCGLGAVPLGRVQLAHVQVNSRVILFY